MSFSFIYLVRDFTNVIFHYISHFSEWKREEKFLIYLFCFCFSFNCNTSYMCKSIQLHWNQFNTVINCCKLLLLAKEKNWETIIFVFRVIHKFHVKKISKCYTYIVHTSPVNLCRHPIQLVEIRAEVKYE